MEGDIVVAPESILSRDLEVVRDKILARLSLPDSIWSHLPKELLDQILARLSLLDDCYRFGLVCRSWQTVMVARRKLCRSPPLLAKLKAVSTDKDLAEETKHELSFSCLIDDEVQELAMKFPVVLDENVFFRLKPCMGKSYGLSFVGAKKQFKYSVTDWYYLLKGEKQKHDSVADCNYLLNLISGERINLPNSRYEIIAAALSAPPSSGDCTVIAFSYSDVYDRRSLRYHLGMPLSCKIGDKEWIPFHKPPLRALCSVFHEGELYVLCHESGHTNIYAFDPHPQLTGSVEASISESNAIYITDTYMVDAGEELFLVAEFRHGKEYQVFKLDERRRWIRIRDLGDRALFLSHTSSYSFCTKEIMDLLNLRANYIYFLNSGYGCLCLSVYSMEDASCKKIFVSSKGEQQLVWPMCLKYSVIKF